MPQPVLVIHGIANRDRTAFETIVATLAANVSDANLTFIPIFWGDLGAQTIDVTDTLPDPQGLIAGGADSLTADAGLAPSAVSPAVAAELFRASQSGFVPSAGAFASDAIAADSKAQVKATAQTSLAASGLAATEGKAAAITNAVDQKWPQTKALQYIRDPQVLAEVGKALGQAMSAVPDAPTFAADDVGADTSATANPQIVADNILTGLDNVLFGGIGQALGRVNSQLRHEYGPAAAEGIGDIFVYQDAERKSGIQGRVRQGLPPGWGTPENPVYVIAHSFGGLIALDMALSHENPLCIKGLITVGSQPGFFHVLQPRASLPPYTSGHPVLLPSTIGGWISLWEPLDVLAFLTAPVFQLASSNFPEDREVAHTSEYGLYTHGCYWITPELKQAIQELFL